jgi:hypothetical protein
MNRGFGLAAWLTAACALGCARAPDAAQASSVPGPPLASPPVSVPADPPAIAPAPAPVPPVAAVTPPAPEPVLAGVDFLSQARVIFRVAACGRPSTEGGDLPPRFDASVVSHHCDDLGHAYDEYRHGWVDVAKPFFAALRPRDLPRVVVYPFGGGDLVSALATFPDAAEITTISLEPAGDVRPVDTLASDRLAHELAVHRSHLERLFEKAHSRTDNLAKEAKTELPGELLFALAALVVHGDEPVSLRYFRLGRDGSVNYVTQADIDAVRGPNKAAEHRALFADAELRFRRSGDAGAPVQVLRHVSYNLDDAHLTADPGLLAYLNGRGKVAAMTKAATHLLWNEHFKMIRGWLVDHTDWMASDSTGLPPRIAGPAGFTQDAYGTFDGPSPFGAPDQADSDDLRHLFAAQPARDLPFRYGYPDSHGHAHLIVTHRPAR